MNGGRRYIDVRCNYDLGGDPYRYPVEADEDGRELRRIEHFEDGRIAYTDTGTSCGAVLADLPIPPLEAIVADPVFQAWYILREAFEEQWARAIEAGGPALDRNTR